jgi:integrase
MPPPPPPAPAAPAAAGAAPEAPAGLTVAELVVRYLRHAECHYRKPDGARTSELDNVRLSMRPLVHLHGRTEAAAFGPLKLKAVRELLVRGYDHPQHGRQPGLVRKQVNLRVGRVVRMFRWGVGEELVPVEVWQALKAVQGLQAGRCDAREGEPVKPVPAPVVVKTLPHLSAEVGAMVQVQRLSGARPGEVCILRPEDIDTGAAVWLYRPRQHKGRHRGKERVVAIGPRAQEVLRRFLRVACPACGRQDRAGRLGWRWEAGLCGPCAGRADGQGACGPWRAVPVPGDYFVFSPREATADRRREQRARRKSKVQPSQVCRRKNDARRQPGERYNTAAYLNAVGRACAKAGVQPWHPHQLRHQAATEIRRRFGSEAAQVALGHSDLNTTEIYAERDLGLAMRVAAELG